MNTNDIDFRQLVDALRSGARPRTRKDCAHDAALAVVRQVPTRPRGRSTAPPAQAAIRAARNLVGCVSQEAKTLILEALSKRYDLRAERDRQRSFTDPTTIPFNKRIPQLVVQRDDAIQRALFDLVMSDESSAEA